MNKFEMLAKREEARREHKVALRMADAVNIVWVHACDADSKLNAISVGRSCAVCGKREDGSMASHGGGLFA